MPRKINFKNDWDAAKEDKAVFNDWLRMAITTRRACTLVAQNNGLEYISEEDFIETAEALGYRRNYDWDDEE